MDVKIVIIEGPDGVGKTTLTDKLVKYFNESTSYSAVKLSTSNTDFGKKIKGILKDIPNLSSSIERDLQLLTHRYISEVEMPKIYEQARLNKKKTLVFIDRWILSTGIYQLFVKHNGSLNYLYYTGESPSLGSDPNPLTIVLDADDDILDDRLYNNDDRVLEDKYENQEMQELVRLGYRSLDKVTCNLPYRTSANREFVDVSGSESDNFKNLLSTVMHYL